METNIVVLDKRLGNKLVNYQSNAYQFIAVDQSTTFPELMRRIKGLAGAPRQKIDLLTIAAHGYFEEGLDGKHYDGFGMQLCKDNLKMETVGWFRALEGCFRSPELGIILLGCGVAAQQTVRTSKGVQVGFGERLCRALCMGAATGVMASTHVQDIEESKYKRRWGASVETIVEIDAGPWEGDVFIFRPDGSKRRP